MTKFLEIVKKYRCVSCITGFVYLIMVVRVQGDISTLLERVLVSFVSAGILITILLYAGLYITGSLNPGDKPLFNIDGLVQKLLKGKSAGQSH